jgi:hypothetical protein
MQSPKNPTTTQPAGVPTPSLKPRRGRSWKRAKRIEIAVRLESLFIPDADIARHMGITVAALYYIKATPEYQAKKITIQTGILSQYDSQINLTAEEQKDEINDLVPLALGAAKTALLDKTNPFHYKFAQDILDRNRATAKISRSELQLLPPPDTHKENEAAKELLSMLEAESIPNSPASSESSPLIPIYLPPESLLTEEEKEALIKEEREEQEAADALIGEILPPTRDDLIQ